MKTLIICLLLVGLSAAFTVEPDYIGVQDTGDTRLPTLDADITIDCDSKQLTVEVIDASGPVEGASVYLFYTDYGYQPLPNSGKTGADGIYVMDVTGSLEFLTALFILRVDHPQHQSREIEFAYQKCFEEPPPAEPECTDDADCPTGYTCDDEECVEAIPEPECTDDSDCPQGYTCDDEECVEAVPELYEPETEDNVSDVVTGDVVGDVSPPPVDGDVAPPCPLGLLLLPLLFLGLRA
jgi:hypothetical protein